ncbi:MAG: GNAT family N-acetyltransferase [Chloroflexia bacterium]
MSTQTQTVEYIEVQGAPNIPGLRFRRFQGMEDIPAMVGVLNLTDPADGSDRVATIESLTKTYENLRNSDAANDVVMIEVNGELIGYTRDLWHVELDGSRMYSHFGFLIPEWRDKGIGAAMIKHNEAHLLELAATHADTGPRWYNTGTLNNQDSLRRLLENEGYEKVRYGYEMVRPDLENIPDISMPEGLEVRPARPEDFPAIWEAEIEAFRDHWGSEAPEEGDYERWKNDVMFQPEIWKVAWDKNTNEVAGMVRGFIEHDENQHHNRKRGYTEYISVRRPWRRIGLAKALMARSMQLQKELGMTETALGLDAQNPNGALDLYKSMGFMVTRTDISYRKPMPL